MSLITPLRRHDEASGIRQLGSENGDPRTPDIPHEERIRLVHGDVPGGIELSGPLALPADRALVASVGAEHLHMVQGIVGHKDAAAPIHRDVHHATECVVFAAQRSDGEDFLHRQ